LFVHRVFSQVKWLHSEVEGVFDWAVNPSRALIAFAAMSVVGFKRSQSLE